jgi:magnesium transporter
MAMIINMFVAAAAGTLVPLGLRAVNIDPALALVGLHHHDDRRVRVLSFLGLATHFRAVPARASVKQR